MTDRIVTVGRREQMRLVNYTNIPTPLIREIIHFIRPDTPGRFTVLIDDWKPGYVQHPHPWLGVAHYTRSITFPTSPAEDVTITVRIPRRIEDWRPRTHGCPRPHAANRLEALVFLLAHELRHFWQANHPKRIDLEDEETLERDADAYAYGRLEDWRRSRNPR